MVEKELLSRNTDEWLALPGEHGITASPVLSVRELFENEHLVASGIFELEDHPGEGRLRVTRLHRDLLGVAGGHGETRAAARPARRRGARGARP